MRAVRHAAAAEGPGALSTGEALVAALVLNRPDWLADLGYTIGQALERIDEGDADLIPRAEKQWRADCEGQAEVAAIAARAGQVADLFGKDSPAEADDPLCLAAALVTYGEAPGYRTPSLTFDVRPIGRALPDRTYRINLCLRPQDGESIVWHILQVHRFAWRPGRRPLDAAEGNSGQPGSTVCDRIWPWAAEMMVCPQAAPAAA